MLGIHVTVPVACFRKGLAREYLGTRLCHRRLRAMASCCRWWVSPVAAPARRRAGRSGTTRRAGQRAWCCGRLAGEEDTIRLGRAILARTFSSSSPASSSSCGSIPPGKRAAPQRSKIESGWRLDQPRQVDRFGGLSLGESTHLVDEVRRLRPTDVGPMRAFLLAERGRLSLPVWVDHVGSAGTRLSPATCSNAMPWASNSCSDAVDRTALSGAFIITGVMKLCAPTAMIRPFASCPCTPWPTVTACSTSKRSRRFALPTIGFTPVASCTPSLEADEDGEKTQLELADRGARALR